MYEHHLIIGYVTRVQHVLSGSHLVSNLSFVVGKAENPRLYDVTLWDSLSDLSRRQNMSVGMLVLVETGSLKPQTYRDGDGKSQIRLKANGRMFRILQPPSGQPKGRPKRPPKLEPVTG